MRRLVVCVSPALDYKFVVNSADPDAVIPQTEKEEGSDSVPTSNRSEDVAQERQEDEDNNEGDGGSRAAGILAGNGTLANSTGNNQQRSSFLGKGFTSWFSLDTGLVIISDTNTHDKRRQQNGQSPQQKVTAFKDDTMCHEAH